MNLQQLETFLWVARLGSIAKASRRLNATQSTVSMRLLELEKDLGVELIDRGGRPRRLTAKGRDLARYAEEIVSLSAEIRHHVGSPETLAGSVRVGVAELIAMTWLPDMVAQLNRQFPRILVELEIGVLGSLKELLDHGDLDILLLPVPTASGDNLIYEYLGKVEFVWMASPKLGLPPQTMVPANLERWPIITMNRQSILHFMIEDWMRKGNARARRIDMCSSLSVCATLTIAGLGISLLPRDFYAEELDQGTLVALDVDRPLPAAEFYAIYPAETAQPLVRLLARLAKRASTFAA